jgi:membrane associated rhomboid family serine protease
VEAHTEIQTYLEQGKNALAQGQARDAAIAYAHGAQMEPHNPMVHLGLAEANLALGNYEVVNMASHRVQELQPNNGIESKTALALLDLLDRRYDRALHTIDQVINEDPSIASTHALRSYLLRALGQDYDANLARTRAARLSYGGRFDQCFPPLDVRPAATNDSSIVPPGQMVDSPPNGAPARSSTEAPFTRPNQVQRQVIRTRFVLGQRPGIVTNVIIALNVLAYLFVAFLSGNILNISQDALVYAGAQNTFFIEGTGQYWRILTAMFLHANLLHIGLNMLSLYIIGRIIEAFYGPFRYLIIYLLSGLAGGICTFFLQPDNLVVGASGAIFGIFGALGVFYIINRRVLGSGAITQWFFLLGLNLMFSLSPHIAFYDHLGGLACGVILALLLTPRLGSRRYL